MVGFLKQFANYELEFSKWLLLGVPLMIAMLTITYLLITRLLYRNKLGRIEGAKEVIEEHLQRLGPFSKEERLVTIVFLVTAFGWIFKNQINGLIGAPLLSDTVTAVSGGVLMFLTPTNLSENEFILEWEDTMKLPWGILLLFGGGMSLAKGMESTGIVQWIGDLIASQPDINPILLILILTGSMLYLTELMSNVALATIYIPVVIGIAGGLDMDPVLLTIPVAIASSYAFMMPISTPPNAIVFASGHIKMRQMMRAGFLLNILAILLLVLASQTLIKWIYS
jgi:sodium-dependent dicarboxylate transporter 2/3/5